MEKNKKIFPFYKLFSYDILFYYAVSILFLNGVKGLSLSEIAVLNGVYATCAIIFQIPAALITDKIGLRNSMILGNIFCLLWGIDYLIAPTFATLAIGDLVLALGFALKGTSESPFLYSSLKKINKLSEFSKVEGKGSSLYFIVEALACIASGYLYKVNVYLPVIFSCICALIATVLAFFTTPIKNLKNANVSPKERKDELISGFKFIFKSKRLHALLVFACLFYGILAVAATYYKTFLTTINVDSTTFGYIFAAASITASIGSLVQEKISKKFRNQTLTVMSLTYAASFVFIGVIATLTTNYNILLITGIVVYLFQMFERGAYRIIVKNYVSNFTTSAIRSKLMSIYYLAENFGSAIMLFLISGMLDVIPIGLVYTLSGFVFSVALIIVLNYMQTRIGLRPEQYTKRDRLNLDD
ncbi:MAG: MFS transporter [Clostridia bacterium]|nr:MFS transporter [Clostridia bacterium]